MILNAIINLLQ